MVREAETFRNDYRNKKTREIFLALRKPLPWAADPTPGSLAYVGDIDDIDTQRYCAFILSFIVIGCVFAAIAHCLAPEPADPLGRFRGHHIRNPGGPACREKPEAGDGHDLVSRERHVAKAICSRRCSIGRRSREPAPDGRWACRDCHNRRRHWSRW